MGFAVSIECNCRPCVRAVRIIGPACDADLDGTRGTQTMMKASAREGIGKKSNTIVDCYDPVISPPLYSSHFLSCMPGDCELRILFFLHFKYFL